MRYCLLFSLIGCLIIGCEDIISVPDISEDAVTVIAPTDGAIVSEGELTFTWEALEFAEDYQVQIATPNFTEANQLVLDTIIGDSLQSIRNVSTTLSADSYQWRIRATNTAFMTDYTTSTILVEASANEIEDISNEAVVIFAPANNTEIVAGSITFNWEEIAGASQYRLQIAQPNFENAEQFITDTLITNTNFSIELASDMYEWRIQALNDISQTAYTTQILTVVEEDIPLSDQTILLLAPEDNFETTETMVNLSWEELEDANLYRIQIINTVDGSVFTDETTTGLDITIDFVSGTYEWSIRGENDTQNTAFSTRTITIL